MASKPPAWHRSLVLHLRDELGEGAPPIVCCSNDDVDLTGARVLVRKPFDPAELVTTVEGPIAPS